MTTAGVTTVAAVTNSGATSVSTINVYSLLDLQVNKINLTFPQFNDYKKILEDLT